MNRPRLSMRTFALVSAVCLAASVARSQCLSFDPQWKLDVPGGPNDTVRATVVFDDGSGPALYVGGSFYGVNGTAVHGLARWNGSSWSTVPGWTGAGSVNAFLLFDDGSGPALFVGTDTNVRRWNGSLWSSLGIASGGVDALTVFDDGTGPALYAGGAFSSIGGVAANKIAKWNGSAWSALAGGLTGNLSTAAFALRVFDDGGGAKLYAGGDFYFANGNYTGGLARWNGSAWSSVGNAGLPSPYVYALAIYDDGSGPALYAGGSFAWMGGVAADAIARWNGSSWSAVGGGLTYLAPFGVQALGVFDDGSGPELYAGGNLSEAGGTAVSMIARWNGSTWSALENGTSDTVRTLCAYDDGGGSSLFVGGDFTAANGLSVAHLARWKSAHWSAIRAAQGHGADDSVHRLITFDAGSGPSLYACGYFTDVGGVAANRVARWDGTTWSPLGAGVDNQADCFGVFDDGGGTALYMGGVFVQSGSVVLNHVGKWDGSAWSPLGHGTNGLVYSLAAFDDGHGPGLFAAGNFTIAGDMGVNHVAKWNGSSWSSLFTGLSSPAYALAVFGDDENGFSLYVAGSFTAAGGVGVNKIARWDGTAWWPLGSGLDDNVLSLCTFDDGSGNALYVGGGFTTAGGVPARSIARWDGASWSAVGTGLNNAVTGMCAFDDGSGPALYAAGYFTASGGTQMLNVARWNGASWTPLGGGTNQQVRTLAVFDDGTGADLYLGGDFTTAGAEPSSKLARWRACASPIDTLCFGDGSVAACPCGNTGAPAHGCDNSIANGGALLGASGTPVPDTLALHASNELPHALSIFLQGNALFPGTARFGDGLRCAAGNLKRLFTKTAVNGAANAPEPGDPSISARSAALGDPIAPGSVRYYQTYYRDPNLSFCTPPQGDSWNVTNAVSVKW
jgi:hypothetical protein